MALSFVQHTALSSIRRPLRPCFHNTTFNSSPLLPLKHPAYYQTSRRAIITATASMASSDRKMLHAVYRVGDLEATRKFLQTLGMHVLRERDVPSEKYTNVFFGFGPEQRGEYFSLELTYNYGVDSYNVGTGFGHFSVAVSDLKQTLDAVKTDGFNVTRDIATLPGESSLSADVVDPTGYHFQLIERKQRDPLCQVMLRITDVEKSIKFYEAMGMKVLRTNSVDGTTRVYMGFGSEDDSTVLQLLHSTQAQDSFIAGDGYAQIAVSCPDVYDAAKQFEEAGITVTRAPGPVPGIGTKICAVRDNDNWKTVMVDAEDFEKEFE